MSLKLSTLYLYTLSYREMRSAQTPPLQASRAAVQHTIVCLLLFLIAGVANIYLRLNKAKRFELLIV